MICFGCGGVYVWIFDVFSFRCISDLVSVIVVDMLLIIGIFVYFLICWLRLVILL